MLQVKIQKRIILCEEDVKEALRQYVLKQGINLPKKFNIVMYSTERAAISWEEKC